MGYYASASAEEKKAVHSTAGYLRSLYVTNVSGAVKYIWVFNNTAASGTRLLPPFAVQPGATAGFNFIDSLRRYSTGLYVASSSTQATYTGSGTSDLMIDADYASEGVVTVLRSRTEATA